jgi:trehalose utilization protein
MPDSTHATSPLVRRRRFLETQLAIALGISGGTRLARAALDDPAERPSPLRVRVWCEGTAPRSIYPEDIDGALCASLRCDKSLAVSSARLEQPDAGVPDSVLDQTDVLVWWGRLKHDEVPDARAQAVVERVKAGTLGLVALHGSYASKPFCTLMGKACEPKAWRDEGKPEQVTIEAPEHPIAKGVAPFTIPRTRMFTEPFEVPEPETVVFRSRWESGESFRSGLTWSVEKGRVAYLRPGDDSYPVLFHPSVALLVLNSVKWTGRCV